MLKNCIVVVQARTNSSRLPGKVMEVLNGKPVIWHVLQRCKQIKGVTGVWCAIPEEEKGSIACFAGEAGVSVFRGSEVDVLSRYFGAAEAANASHIIRITSDCPLISPSVCEDLILLMEKTNSDYCSNNMPRSWPHGLDCEIFSFEALQQAFVQATTHFEKEHVTPWMKNNSQITKANLVSKKSWDLSIRLTLDYPEDLYFFQELFTSLDVSPKTSLEQIMEFLANNPKIADINRTSI